MPGSTEPDVHRAFELESSFDMHDVQMALQINTLCQPRGRRLCTFQAEGVPMIPMMEYNALPGSYITVDIQEERPVFNIQRACQELDSVLDDIQLAQQDEQIRQIRFIQHGYRYRSLGTVNQPWSSTSTDPVAVSQNFAAGWIQQPLDRSQIYRVRALDNVDPTLGVLSLHFIITFDLIPGFATCLALQGTSPPWVLAGPSLLQPQYWDVNSLDDTVPNPLRTTNYEILLFPGRAPTLTARSGDVIMYGTPEVEGAPSSHPPQPEQEEHAEALLLQTLRQVPLRDVTNWKAQESDEWPPSQKARRSFVYNFSDKDLENPVEHEQPQAQCRPVLRLFPLLNETGYNITLPGQPEECATFLQACEDIHLRHDIPDELRELCLPVVGAYFDTCTTLPGEPDEYLIYTDGSSKPCERIGLQTRDASWAMLVIGVKDSKRAIIGWTGGHVRADPEDIRWIGADDYYAMNAERTAVFWAMAWSLGRPTGQKITLHVDNLAAGYGADGTWSIDSNHILSKRLRLLTTNHCGATQACSESGTCQSTHAESPERVCRQSGQLHQRCWSESADQHCSP